VVILSDYGDEVMWQRVKLMLEMDLRDLRRREVRMDAWMVLEDLDVKMVSEETGW